MTKSHKDQKHGNIGGTFKLERSMTPLTYRQLTLEMCGGQEIMGVEITGN